MKTTQTEKQVKLKSYDVKVELIDGTIEYVNIKGKSFSRDGYSCSLAGIHAINPTIEHVIKSDQLLDIINSKEKLSSNTIKKVISYKKKEIIDTYLVNTSFSWWNGDYYSYQKK